MLNYVLYAIPPVSIIAGLLLLRYTIKHWTVPSTAKHRHLYNIRRRRNEYVDIKEILETAEIRRG